MSRILTTLFCLFMFSSINAQIHEIGVFAGGSNFVGDVGSTTYVNPNKLAIGAFYKWNRSTRHSWRASLMQTTLRGFDYNSDDPSRKERGFEFKNSIQELSVGLEFNFFDFNLHDLRRQVTPYIATGLSVLRYDSQYFENGGTEFDEKKYTMAIPMTLGVKSNITPNFVLGLEASARFSFTDNLDASNPDLENAPKFGNLNNKDWYVFTGITLSYTFGNNPCYCPE